MFLSLIKILLYLIDIILESQVLIMNAIYLCTIAQPWIEVSQKLSNELNIKSSYFVYWKAEKKQFLEANFEGCHLQTVDEAWKGLGFPKHTKRYIFDEEELKIIASFELTALKMMDRLDPDGESFPFTTRQYFFRDLLGYWYSIVEEREIDLVISPSIPHRVFDYALYTICQIKNIKFLMFQMTPFGSNSILIDNIDEMPKIDSTTIVNTCLSPVILNKINMVLESYDKAIPEYMVKHEVNAKKNLTQLPLKTLRKVSKSYKFVTTKPNTYWVKQGCAPNETEFSWLDFYKMQAKRNKKVESFKDQYGKLTTSTFNDDLVLVALHYQPEETSCPTGGAYADQILIIQLLDQVLPQEIDIVIKEHKSQFYSHQEGASGRSKLYYRRLSQISNRVKLVSESENPFNLIDKAKAVVTISGTIGWESAIRGTPVIVFGRAWYENMPRVLKVKTRQDLLNALENIDELKNKDLYPEILYYHSQLERHFVKAKHYKANLDKNDITMKDSITNIVKGISDYLESRP